MLELDEILGRYRPNYEIIIRFPDTDFIIKTNNQELARKLSNYFKGWQSREDPGELHVIHAIVGEGTLDRDKLMDVVRRPGKQVKEAYYDSGEGRVVFKKRTGVIIYLKGDECFVVGDLLNNLNQIVNQINQVYIQDFLEKGYLLFHASAVANNEGRSLMFCSDSGVGKSTVAVAMLERGYKFLSNDRVLLKLKDGAVDVVGVPKKPRVNPGTMLAIPALAKMLSPKELKRYSAMDKEDLWYLESKHDVEVNKEFGPGSLILRATLDAVYLLGWNRTDASLDVEQVSHEKAPALLRENVLNLTSKFNNAGMEGQIEAQLKELTGLVKLYRIGGGVDIAGLCRYLELQNEESDLPR